MQKRVAAVHLDTLAQRITVNGRPVKLQAKAARVLTTIAASAPHAVSRTDLIKEIWAGNHLVGDRGLNQAMWAIRAALGDNAREPTFIRTLSREGFQWIHKPSWHHDRRHRLAFIAAIAASISVVAIVSLTSSPTSASEYALPGQCEIAAKSDVRAYKLKRDVIIDIQNGCRLIVRPSGTKNFGEPVVSEDGQHVAFTVREEQGCRFVSLALQQGVRTDFDTCAIHNDVRPDLM